MKVQINLIVLYYIVLYYNIITNLEFVLSLTSPERHFVSEESTTNVRNVPSPGLSASMALCFQVQSNIREVAESVDKVKTVLGMKIQSEEKVVSILLIR